MRRDREQPKETVKYIWRSIEGKCCKLSQSRENLRTYCCFCFRCYKKMYYKIVVHDDAICKVLPILSILVFLALNSSSCILRFPKGNFFLAWLLEEKIWWNTKFSSIYMWKPPFINIVSNAIFLMNIFKLILCWHVGFYFWKKTYIWRQFHGEKKCSRI